MFKSFKTVFFTVCLVAFVLLTWNWEEATMYENFVGFFLVAAGFIIVLVAQVQIGGEYDE